LIAFDLDGVFITDFDQIEHLSTSEFNYLRSHTKPLFHPTGEFYIVTSRGPEHMSATTEYCQKFKELPREVFVNVKDLDPIEFKIQILREHPEITTFVESDANVVMTLKREFSKLNVIYFSEFLELSFN